MQNIDALSKIILESLALNFNDKCLLLEKIIKKKINIIHVIGGGAKNELFCQYTANATGKIIYSGPEEATTIGNALMQLISSGEIQPSMIIKIIKKSFNIKRYFPARRRQWVEKKDSYEEVIKRYNSHE